MRRIGSVLVALIVSSAVSGSAQGLSRADSVQRRNDCRLAAQIVRTGQPQTKRTWAADVIGRCGREGPPAIVELWRTAPADIRSLTALLAVGSRLPDRRLAAFAMTVAQDPARPALVRAAAMVLIGRFLDSHDTTPISEVIQAVDRPGHTCMRRYSFHTYAVAADVEPLEPGFRDTALRVLRVLQHDPGSDLVRTSARCVASFATPGTLT
ncbi:MAG: hypothetical protein JWM27_3961 [Gemmatimonadetes bacterium]|nr:hypothetical protein [Gemmatimonadota bacterium]